MKRIRAGLGCVNGAGLGCSGYAPDYAQPVPQMTIHEAEQIAVTAPDGGPSYSVDEVSQVLEARTLDAQDKAIVDLATKPNAPSGGGALPATREQLEEERADNARKLRAGAAIGVGAAIAAAIMLMAARRKKRDDHAR